MKIHGLPNLTCSSPMRKLQHLRRWDSHPTELLHRQVLVVMKRGVKYHAASPAKEPNSNIICCLGDVGSLFLEDGRFHREPRDPWECLEFCVPFHGNWDFCCTLL